MHPQAERVKEIFTKMAPLLEEFQKIAFMEIPKSDQDELEAWVRKEYPTLMGRMLG